MKGYSLTKNLKETTFIDIATQIRQSATHHSKSTHKPKKTQWSEMPRQNRCSIETLIFLKDYWGSEVGKAISICYKR